MIYLYLVAIYRTLSYSRLFKLLCTTQLLAGIFCSLYFVVELILVLLCIALINILRLKISLKIIFHM